MTITQEQIKRIAEKLSKIPGDNKKIAQNIQDNVTYMELLSEVDTTGVIPTISVIKSNSLLRKDEFIPTISTPKELLQCSEQRVIGNHIVLPNIMN